MSIARRGKRSAAYRPHGLNPASAEKEQALQSLLYYRIVGPEAPDALDAHSMRAVNTSAHRRKAPQSAQATSIPNSAAPTANGGSCVNGSTCWGARESEHAGVTGLPPAKPSHQALTWQLDDISMLLGSDMLIFTGDGLPEAGPGARGATSVKLRDIEKLVTASTCVDLWLENVLNAADSLALCYHKEGVVQVRACLLPSLYPPVARYIRQLYRPKTSPGMNNPDDRNMTSWGLMTYQTAPQQVLDDKICVRCAMNRFF